MPIGQISLPITFGT
jgi:hypothetical protein